MAFKNIKGNIKNSLLDYFVSGKAVQYHSAEFGNIKPFAASGGTKIIDGSSTYHVFTGSSDFTISAGEESIEVLIVAGGGSGAGSQGGGGGGSGIVHSSAINGVPGTYTVTVGGGGASVSPPIGYDSLGAKGSSSSFNSVAAVGGGGGIYNNTGYPGLPAPLQASVIGANGGGGGGGSGPGAAGDGITPQPVPGDYTAYGGNAGDPQAISPGGSGGGGGGAGAAAPTGSPRPSGTAAPGGAGQPFANFPGPGIYNAAPGPLQTTLTTAWRDALGPTGLFGGGGGGGDNDPTGGNGFGGPGGGGNGGAESITSTQGVDYTGGGGGSIGAITSIPGESTSKGGDGIVIIRYTS